MTDPLATLAAEQHAAVRIREWDGGDWRVDESAIATAVLDGYTATWERDGNGLRRLVLTGTWETDPEADLR